MEPEGIVKACTRLQVIVPVELCISLALGLILDELVSGVPRLLVDGIGRIIQRPFPEVLLESLLHLDNEGLSVVTFSRDVEYDLPVLFRKTEVLVGDEVHRLDLLVLQNHVQEVLQDILVGLASEQSFEHEVTQQFGVLLPAFLLLHN